MYVNIRDRESERKKKYPGTGTHGHTVTSHVAEVETHATSLARITFISSSHLPFPHPTRKSADIENILTPRIQNVLTGYVEELRYSDSGRLCVKMLRFIHGNEAVLFN